MTGRLGARNFTFNLGMRYEMVTVPDGSLRAKLVNLLNVQRPLYPTVPTSRFFPGECDPNPLYPPFS